MKSTASEFQTSRALKTLIYTMYNLYEHNYYSEEVTVLAVDNIVLGEGEKGEMKFKNNMNSRFTTFTTLSSDANSLIH